jgi:hypothetical protein
MTTDTVLCARRLVPLVLAAPLVLVLWGLVLVAATLVQPAGRAVAVLAPGGPAAALAAVAAAGGAILEIRPTAVIAIAEDPAFVRRLYQHGPLIVVAARGPGCGIRAGFRSAPPISA